MAQTLRNCASRFGTKDRLGCAETWHCRRSHKVRHDKAVDLHPQPKLVLLLLRKCCQQQPIGREAKRVQATATERPRSCTHIMAWPREVQAPCTITEEVGPATETVSFLPFGGRSGGLCPLTPIS